MRREGRVTVQGPVKEQQPDGMSHRGGVVAVAVFAEGMRGATAKGPGWRGCGPGVVALRPHLSAADRRVLALGCRVPGGDCDP